MKLNSKVILTGLVVAFASASFAQSWTSEYEAGLKAAKDNKWDDARKSFLQARSKRPEDVAAPTQLPGPATEQRKWRNGAAYSPNFLAAYSSYRKGLTEKEGSESFKIAAQELEVLVAKKQVAPETLYILKNVYTKLGLSEKRSALGSVAPNPNWKVDTEIFTPEEQAQMGTTTSSSSQTSIVATVDANKLPTNSSSMTAANANGPVAIVPTKYALIIGNSDNKLNGFSISHAADDARLLKESLNASAGYAAENTEIVLNATAAQIKATAEALAARMPAEGTLFLFYTGAGVNVEGKDYLAGVETEIPTDTSSMISKTDLLKSFTVKGIKVFSFYQVPRPNYNNRFFGTEEPKVGLLSQMQSTIPGENIFTVFRGGKTVGLFASSLAQVIDELHSNAIPINEFGWQVFYKMRRGTSGTSGGGSRQTPTLPIVISLASDARF